jgi:hypothetical protein
MKNKHKKISIIIFFLLCLVILELILLLSGSGLPFLKKPQSAKSLSILADRVIQKCAGQSSKAACYDREIPRLMSSITMEEAFQVTRIIQDKDSSYKYCHVVGHNLSALEVKRNPEGWKDVVTRCPSGICSNGCIHGGMQERFRAESLTDKQIKEIIPDLKTICEKRGDWTPTGLERASCQHALGHLLMYTTNADINKSISLCSEVTQNKRMCFDGAFMQIFQPLDPEDFALIKGKQPTIETIESFCASYQGTQKSSCWNESWPLRQAELVKDPNELVSFCGWLEDDMEIEYCYKALFYVLATQFGLDEKRIVDYCTGLPEYPRGICFASSASRFIETDYRNIDTAVGICNKAPVTSQKICYDELVVFAGFNFHNGSEEKIHLCKQLPDPWGTTCLERALIKVKTN